MLSVVTIVGAFDRLPPNLVEAKRETNPSLVTVRDVGRAPEVLTCLEKVSLVVVVGTFLAASS